MRVAEGRAEGQSDEWERGSVCESRSFSFDSKWFRGSAFGKRGRFLKFALGGGGGVLAGWRNGPQSTR